MRHSCRIEVSHEGQWHAIVGDCALAYGHGYIDARRGCPGPRPGVRLIRSDGKVIDEAPALDEVSIGMVAGWPTAAQYRAAASRALAKADEIEKRGGR